MLTVVLAGLVLNKVLTIEQAERVRSELVGKQVPESVTETVKELQDIIDDIKEKK